VKGPPGNRPASLCVGVYGVTGSNVEFHEIASLFPMMDSEEYAALKASIEASGLRKPIVLYEGKILDGRNRYRACVELGKEPSFESWQGDDPWEMAITTRCGTSSC
jgi:hypothetical protein